MIHVNDELGEFLRRAPETLTDDDQKRVRAALDYATQAHGDRRRPSGEGYVEHAHRVAAALDELGMDDVDTTAAALLHDVLLPHTGLRPADLTKAFGGVVAGLVRSLKTLGEYAGDAVRKRNPAQLTLEAPQDRDALEVLRRALLSIIEGDIRIILIRMVDSLEDLHRAGSLPAEEQRRVAWEAMHIYAPLANRLGIWHLKWQLEDMAFRFLEPRRYFDIARRLDEKRELRALKIGQAAARLRQRLAAEGLKATVTGRPKHIYSIYRKMLRKELDFEQIYDIQALRIILEPPEALPREEAGVTKDEMRRKKEKAGFVRVGGRPDDEAPPNTGKAYVLYEDLTNNSKDEYDRNLCYRALGVVHSMWRPVRGEFDDYIGSPKPNGYKSLHTAVIDNETGQKLEVQIRSQRMHEEAERGVAAHWAYKEQDARLSNTAQRRIQNLRELLATLQEAEDDPEGTPLIDIAALEERIHVFTPLGKVIDLPRGATPIDFAYAVHTELGHRCRGARVNGRIVSLDYQLQSGDNVEIIAPKKGTPGRPRRDWLNSSLGYTASARTRGKIRHWFRQQERDQNMQQGQEVIERELRGLSLLDTFTVKDIAEALKYTDIDDFLCKVGFGDIQTTQVVGAIGLLQKKLKKKDEELLPLLRSTTRPQSGMLVSGVGGMHTRMALCCNPIAPEPIVGYITRGQGVTVHRQDCKQLKAIQDHERLVEVEWGAAETHPVPVVVAAYPRKDLIENVVNVLRSQRINVTRAKTEMEDGLMMIYMLPEVANLQQLTDLLLRLDHLPGVVSAERANWN